MGLFGGIAAGVGSLLGAGISANASESAAQAQANAANQASANQLAEFQQTRQTLAPFVGAGTNALSTLQESLGLGGGGYNLSQANGLNSLTFQPTQAQLAATPGYQFIKDQTEQAIASSNAATGGGISGAALKAAGNYASGLASTTLGQQQQIFQQNLGNVLNPLSNLAGQGENAAATTGQQGVQAVGQANQALIGGANAQAAGTVGAANAISGGIGAAANTPLNYLLYNQLLSGGGGGVPTADSLGLNNQVG
jgi:hypothetical protein